MCVDHNDPNFGVLYVYILRFISRYFKVENQSNFNNSNFEAF